jgi:hypothetical protein
VRLEKPQVVITTLNRILRELLRTYAAYFYVKVVLTVPSS